MNLSRLKSTAEKLLQAEGCSDSTEVSVVLVDDPGITELNREYKGKDNPTDVLSFYQYDDPAVHPDVLGDVVISVDTAIAQAEERAKPVDDELDLLLCHGILHLLGFTDDTTENANIMQERAAAVIGEQAAR